MFKTMTVAAALMGGAMLAAPASAAPMGSAGASAPVLAQTGSDLLQTVQYRRYGHGPRFGGRGYGYGPRYGYRGGYYRGGGRGAAIGAGIAAGAIGALAAGAIASQARPVYVDPVYPAAPVYVSPDSDAIAYCSRRFRTYDPATGTYIATGGIVRSCP